MDKEMEKECVYIKKTTFNKYWDILKRNYSDRTHTEKDANIYYSRFKDLTDEEFMQTIRAAIDTLRFFPNVAELRECIPKKTEINMDKWKNLKSEPLNNEDKEWARKFYKKYCDTEKEYHERLIRNGL